MFKNHKKTLLLLIFLILSAPVFSQSKIYILKNRKKAKVGFELINNLIVLPVYLNGKELSFILDSGAKNTVLFGATPNDSLILNDQVKTSLRGLGGGEAIPAIISQNNRIKMDDIFGYNVKVYVILDERLDLSLKMGKPIHGIIGYDLLKNFVTKIDYSKRNLTFYDPNHFQEPKKNNIEQFNLIFHKEKPYLSCDYKIDEHTSNNSLFLIDTGSSDAVWLFENESKNISTKRKFFWDYVGEGLSGPIKGKRTKIDQFSIDNFAFDNVTTAFLDSTAAPKYNSNFNRGGSIGSLLLERFKVILDYPNQKLYLKKAKGFKEDFTYNLAGLGVSYDKDAKTFTVRERNTGIKVVERNNNLYEDLFEIKYEYELKRLFSVYYVRPDSPAEKVGLKVKDIILEINGKPAYNYSLEEITAFFYGKQNEIIRLKVERNGLVLYFEFRLDTPL